MRVQSEPRINTKHIEQNILQVWNTSGMARVRLRYIPTCRPNSGFLCISRGDPYSSCQRTTQGYRPAPSHGGSGPAAWPRRTGPQRRLPVLAEALPGSVPQAVRPRADLTRAGPQPQARRSSVEARETSVSQGAAAGLRPVGAPGPRTRRGAPRTPSGQLRRLVQAPRRPLRRHARRGRPTPHTPPL